jgi:hypothetical protein
LLDVLSPAGSPRTDTVRGAISDAAKPVTFKRTGTTVAVKAAGGGHAEISADGRLVIDIVATTSLNLGPVADLATRIMLLSGFRWLTQAKPRLGTRANLFTKSLPKILGPAARSRRSSGLAALRSSLAVGSR